MSFVGPRALRLDFLYPVVPASASCMKSIMQSLAKNNTLTLHIGYSDKFN
jgi:hypothetical protein